MGYYQDLLNKISIIETQGFNPYQEDYMSRIGQLITPVIGDGLEAPSTTPEAIPETQPITEQQYYQAWGEYGQAQADVTRAFQQRFPQVPVGDILRDVSSIEGFSNRELAKYASPYVKQYGDISLSQEEVKAASPRYYDIKKTLREGDILYGKASEKETETKGTKEKEVDEDLFSFKNIFQRRTITGEESEVYKFLIDDEELLKEVEKKSKQDKK